VCVSKHSTSKKGRSVAKTLLDSLTASGPLSWREKGGGLRERINSAKRCCSQEFVESVGFTEFLYYINFSWGL